MSDGAIHKAVDAARTFLQNDAERRVVMMMLPKRLPMLIFVKNFLRNMGFSR